MISTEKQISRILIKATYTDDTCIAKSFVDANLNNCLYELEHNEHPASMIKSLVMSGRVADDAPSLSSIREGCFNKYASLKELVIPKGITELCYNAFEYCRSLTKIMLPSTLKTIGKEAFMNCSSLKEITIPGSVVSIGKEAFMNCSSLTSITLPSALKTIGKECFMNCASLNDITIPSVQSIICGPNAFTGVPYRNTSLQ